MVLFGQSMAEDEEEEGEAGEGGKKAAEEDVVYRYVPPEPKEWVSQGSEREIDEEAFTDLRKKAR